MSKWNMEKITCPNCGEVSNFKVWSSVNVAKDPKMKDRVMSEEMFTFSCPNCKKEAYTNYGFVYHDPDRELFLVYGATEDNYDALTAKALVETEKSDDAVERMIEKINQGYEKRIVNSMNDMKEKILIADAELDDRIIELIKVIYAGKIQDNNPNINFDELRFDMDADGMHLVLLFKNEAIGAIDFSEEFYQLIAMEYEEQLLECAEAALTVDMEWASDFLQNEE